MLYIYDSYAKIDRVWEKNGNNGGTFKTFSISTSTKGKAAEDPREYSNWNAIMVKDAKNKQDELAAGSRIKIIKGGVKSLAPKGEDGKWAKDENGKSKPANVNVVIFEYELQEDTRQQHSPEDPENGNEDSAF